MIEQQTKFCRLLFSLLFERMQLFDVMRKMAYALFVVLIEIYANITIPCCIIEFLVTGILFGI